MEPDNRVHEEVLVAMAKLLRADPVLQGGREAGRNCLDEEAIAAFVAGSVGERRPEIVQHLAECARCRRAVASLSEALADPEVAAEVATLEGAGVGRKYGARWALAALAGAAVVLLVLRSVSAPPGRGEVGVLRGAHGPEGVPMVVAVTPANDATIARGSPFVWRSAGPSAQYRVTITDKQGVAVWTGASADTTVTPPRSVGLEPSHEYFWSVSALLLDGRSGITAVRRFRVAP